MQAGMTAKERRGKERKEKEDQEVVVEEMEARIPRKRGPLS